MLSRVHSSRVVAALTVGVAGVLLGGCGAPHSATGAVVVASAPSSTVATAPIAEHRDAVGEPAALLTDGRDERHGEVDGRAWTLITTLSGASMCLQLGWDDVDDAWEVCYSTDYAALPLAWTNPTPPTGGHREMMFVVGLAPQATAHLQVVRGDVVVGEADAFAGGELVPDRAGFAIPIVVESRDALQATVVLPGDDLRAGVLPPLDVIARDAAGDELARSEATVGSSGPMICVDTGAAILDWSGACLLPQYPAAVISNDGGHLLVPAGGDAATVDLVLDGVVTDTHATAVITAPAGQSWPPIALAGFVLAPGTDWYPLVAETRDTAGRLLTSMPLGGGGEGDEGEVPETL